MPERLSLVHPRELLAPHRLDIVVKYRMFAHLLTGDGEDAETLYRWHIERRTGGREPGSPKQTVDAHVEACRELLASMQAHGFKREHPVRIGSNGRMTAGAHRAACALALGIPAWRLDIPRPGRSGDWGPKWFRRKGLAVAEVAALQRERERLAAQ